MSGKYIQKKSLVLEPGFLSVQLKVFFINVTKLKTGCADMPKLTVLEQANFIERSVGLI